MLFLMILLLLLLLLGCSCAVGVVVKGCRLWRRRRLLLRRL